MFNIARVRLTIWYSLIIMLISISFSVAMYRILASELDRVARIQRTRVEYVFPGYQVGPQGDFQPGSVNVLYFDPDLIAETKNRLATILAGINLLILGASAAAGYFLAGRTLQPIKEMVDEQNHFITDASHELRTPLTAMKSEIEVNLRDSELNLAGAKNLLKSNLEEVNNLQSLSDNLIELTQFKKGVNGTINFEDVSLKLVADEAVKKVASLAKDKNIAIKSKVRDLRLEGNKQTLTELLVIFLDNAIKYSQSHSTISLTAERDDGLAVIKIADQGIGISREDIPHIFDRFYRADKSRTKVDVPGYGLGLSIAKQIADKHGGTIRVQSAPLEGTTFTIQLPIRQADKFNGFFKHILS